MYLKSKNTTLNIFLCKIIRFYLPNLNFETHLRGFIYSFIIFLRQCNTILRSAGCQFTHTYRRPYHNIIFKCSFDVFQFSRLRWRV